jgi:glutaredoxin 3
MIKVYTMDHCPFCEAAKQLLKKRGIEFSELRLSQNDNTQWEALYRQSGMKTVPQIFVGDRLIGGFQELTELDKTDKLLSLKGT